MRHGERFASACVRVSGGLFVGAALVGAAALALVFPAWLIMVLVRGFGG